MLAESQVDQSPLRVDFVAKLGYIRRMLVSHAAGGDRLWCAGLDALYATLTLRDALNRTWRRTGDQRCEPPQVLGDGRENKLVLGASRATQSKPT